MIPAWLTDLSVLMLALGVICSLIIAIDLLRGNKQHMWIMNVVWPITALYGSVIAVWAYFKYGRLATDKKVKAAMERNEEMPNKKYTPFPAAVAKGTTHCGAGCTLGDIVAEFLALGVPGITVWAGWKSIFPPSHDGKIFAVWVIDFAFAFVIGVAFQYFTIKPMRNLSPFNGLIQAVKADTLSLSAWQLGMYGFMAVANFYLFVDIWPQPIEPNMPAFWFMMQIAMMCGFVTAYPVNWWLIRKDVKERM